MEETTARIVISSNLFFKAIFGTTQRRRVLGNYFPEWY
jgi:hypothetical protein